MQCKFNSNIFCNIFFTGLLNMFIFFYSHRMMTSELCLYLGMLGLIVFLTSLSTNQLHRDSALTYYVLVSELIFMYLILRGLSTINSCSVTITNLQRYALSKRLIFFKSPFTNMHILVFCMCLCILKAHYLCNYCTHTLFIGQKHLE